MGYGNPMPDRDPAEIRRSKLIGRTLIVVLGLLMAAYAVATFWNIKP